MADNRGAAYTGPGEVEVHDIDFPTFELQDGPGAPRRRPTSCSGHEITGEVVETGPGVEFIKEGDFCSVPFNIACGRCACARRATPASA